MVMYETRYSKICLGIKSQEENFEFLQDNFQQYELHKLHKVYRRKLVIQNVNSNSTDKCIVYKGPINDLSSH